MNDTSTTPHGLTQTEISRAIGLSRIILIVGLIFVHYGTFPNSLRSPFLGVDIADHTFATWLNSAILFFFFSAVPVLSMVSGWLFFSFKPENAGEGLKKRIKRRFTSLYIPLVVWNAGYLAALFALYMVAPHASPFNHANRIDMNFATAGWYEYMNAVFGVTSEPLAFQFWFVRDLFVVVLVSPIMWQILKHAPWLGALALGAIWLSGWNLCIFTRADVPFFFYMGAIVRLKQLPMTIPLKTALAFFGLYVALVALRASVPFMIPIHDFPDSPYWLECATRAMRIVGVLGTWGVIYRLAQTNTGAAVSSVGGLAFFLHSAHWPMLAVVKVVLWKLMPGDSDAWMLVHFIASVAVTTMLGLGFGFVLAKFAPRIFSLMNGGRLLGQTSSKPADQQALAGPVPLQAAV